MKPVGSVFAVCTVVVFMILPATQAPAAVPEADREAITRAADDYAKQLAAVAAGSERRSLERVFQAGQRAVDLLQKPVEPSAVSFLEAHNDVELAPLLTKLRGFNRAGEEGQNLFPSWNFFRELAEQKGMPADREFFGLMQATEDESGFPSYVEQATDYSGCTKYGSNLLVQLYGRWRNFRQKFPAAYKTLVEEQLQEIASEFTEGNCACGQKDTVVAEFESFLKANPNDPIIPALSKRLDDIRAGRSDYRYHCTPQ